jgi:hypothetical protein
MPGCRERHGGMADILPTGKRNLAPPATLRLCGPRRRMLALPSGERRWMGASAASRVREFCVNDKDRARERRLPSRDGGAHKRGPRAIPPHRDSRQPGPFGDNRRAREAIPPQSERLNPAVIVPCYNMANTSECWRARAQYFGD